MHDSLIEPIVRAMCREAGNSMLVGDRAWMALSRAALAAIEASGFVVVPRATVENLMGRGSDQPLGKLAE